MLQEKKVPQIGLIELPIVNLIDLDGRNWSKAFRGMPLLSKQVLLSHLQAGGFDAQLVNLKEGLEWEELGTATWRGRPLIKVLFGKKIAELDPESYDAWGVTVNFTLEREAACRTIKHLARGGKPIVVGGSDAIAAPELYLQAGATAVVLDKSGAANWAIFDYVLQRPPREELSGVILADGRRYAKKLHPLSPEAWPVPSVEVAKNCLGKLDMEEEMLAFGFPSGSVIPDIGCDRTCDFCQTPTYGLGYLRMSPQKALQWFAVQKEAGARTVMVMSDQFLGRVMFPEGRQEILEITRGFREMGLMIHWSNGLELRKATLGRGIRLDSDLTPDEELIQAVWGWDGKVGCSYAYIPAERPVFGTQSYRKLLPWEHHRTMLRAIVQAGIPSLSYGVIIGLPDDNHESLLRLEEAVSELFEELKTINPSLVLSIAPYPITPIPGTPQGQNIRQSGFLQFDDPAIVGGFQMACADTNYLSYEEVADWQIRLEDTFTAAWSRFSFPDYVRN